MAASKGREGSACIVDLVISEQDGRRKIKKSRFVLKDGASGLPLDVPVLAMGLKRCAQF
jgi:hypothetical protein